MHALDNLLSVMKPATVRISVSEEVTFLRYSRK